MNKTVQFNAAIQEISKINPLFSKANIRVLYTGANRNNTFIAKDTVDRALPSIYNIPIIGEFIEQIDDFGGHGGKVEISDQGIKFIQTTKAYGVVPESANIYWQPIAEADGIVREYLIVEGAYLWTGRYPETNTILDDPKGQSMEIEVLNGHVDDKNLVVIDDMVFSALCILGDNVEPCFESANINAYSFKKDEFKQEFVTMMKELKASLNEDVENNGKEVDSVKEADDKEFSVDLASEVQEQELGNASVSEEVIEVVEVVVESNEEITNDDAANEFQAVTEEVAVVEEVNYAAKVEILESQLAALQSKYDDVVAEKDELFAYKENVEKKSHEAAAEELFAQFEKLDEEEIQQVRTEMFSLSLEQIEEKLYFILGRKVAKFSSNAKKTETVKVVFSQSGKEKEVQNGYELSHIFEKFAD
jgi:hypothetical protein